MRGRTPDPRSGALIVLPGTPAGNPTAPLPPRRLTGVARETWTRLALPLYQAGRLTDLFLDEFETYCDAVEQRTRLQAIVKRKRNLTFKTPNGAVQQIPEIGMLNKAIAVQQKLGEGFGLTPWISQRMGPKGKGKPAAAAPRSSRGPSLMTRVERD